LCSVDVAAIQGNPHVVVRMQAPGGSYDVVLLIWDSTESTLTFADQDTDKAPAAYPFSGALEKTVEYIMYLKL